MKKKGMVKMNKKGFTLIELLAVIVILAIIALIATPAVLNIIEDSRKGAAEASARSIVSAAKTYTMQSTMNGSTVNSIDLSTDTLKYDGEQATKGYVVFDKDGKATSKMYVNGYCVDVAANGDVTSEKMDEEDCSITIEETPVTYTKYNDGTPLYFNPTNGVKCNAKDAISTIGTKSGCMKFYAFLDNETSERVNLILDHNTTATSIWNIDSTGITPDTTNAQLASDTTGWKEVVNGVEKELAARLISASEINRIAPLVPFSYGDVNENNEEIIVNIDKWEYDNENSGYYLATGKLTEAHFGSAGTNKYAWLFDNTHECTKYGCNSEESQIVGYWTSSYGPANKSWAIGYYGVFMCENAQSSDLFGVRPVITVDKSIFE